MAKVIEIECIEGFIVGGNSPNATTGNIYKAWKKEDGWLWFKNDQGEEEWILKPKREFQVSWFREHFTLPQGWDLDDVNNMEISTGDEGETESFESAYDRAMSIL